MLKSSLTQGNQAFRDKDYQAAIHHYRNAIATQPGLQKILQKNIELAQKRLGIAVPQKTTLHSVAIDVVVPVYNALPDVQACLSSLDRNRDGYDVRIIIVNDGSDVPTTQWLRCFAKDCKDVLLIEHANNMGYTKTVNAGLKASTAPYVITQNSDTIVAPGWLRGMVRCMESDAKIGIVGPLSNAASWQNVPNLRDEFSGGFAVNQLPQGLDVDGMARLVAEVSERRYPRLPFVNGFCFMIRRAVIEAIGYMDEENFPIGYGEENDYCIRAANAGFDLAIADDVYVYHAKSKSFGHEQRKELSAQGTEQLKRIHGASKYTALVDSVKRNALLDEVRARVRAALDARVKAPRIDLTSMRVLFLLPVKGGGGGAHSVVQEVAEMRRLGIHAMVGVKYEHIGRFLNMYEDIVNVGDMFVGFDDLTLLNIAEYYDIVVGTIYSSMRLVKRIVEAYPHILPAYYVQDYEPLFFEKGSPQWHEARESYTLIPNAFLFAKTRWIIDEVYRNHSVEVHKVEPSIDHEVYRPIPRVSGDRVHVVAMIRPQTPLRGAERTMRLLKRLYKVHGDRLAVRIFGCESNHPAFQALEQDFQFENRGELSRPQVALLLAESDLFLDLSDYQAFGRTALEAMACGCAAVVPAAGGAGEYAVHGVNALVVDTRDEDACFETISGLLASAEALQALRHAGLATAARYSVHAAAVSECIALHKRLCNWRTTHPRKEKPLLLLKPSQRGDGLPTGSGYVRVVLPYQSPTILKHWSVRHVNELPQPGSAQAILIQREALGLTLQQLENWLPRWKAAGGKLLYDIDDDLLDVEGLRSRHYKHDLHATQEKVRYLTQHADLVHTSTENLAKLLRPYNANIRVVPNFLDPQLWKVDQPRRHDEGPYRRTPDGPVRIGYIGTATHDEDLDMVAEVMRTIEKKYGDAVEIEVIGAFQGVCPKFGKVVGLPKKNDYPNFVRWLCQRVHWDIGIIPLTNNRFNASKSYLKFLEYAALDMAIVVSDVVAYRPVARNMENCLMVNNNTHEWLSALEELIAHPELRERLASCARQELVRHSTWSLTVELACVK